jgi:hypothetical protein
MKRSLFLAISVVALTAASQPLFAAEAETPAPRERAAQRERAPARQAPQRAAPAQSQSSFTGSQAGGFGGGNAGGGGFADPICLNQFGGLNHGCTAAPFTHSLNKTGGVGGVVAEYKWAVPTGFGVGLVVGVLADLSFGKTTASGSQSVVYSTSPPDFPGQVTTENYTSRVSQGTSGSARLKVGVVTPLPGMYTAILPYFTAGVVVAKFDGSFTYTASNFNSSLGCTAFNPSCSTIAASTVEWSRTRTGFVGGGGVEFKVPAFGPGVVIALDYSRYQFASFDQDLPVAIKSVPGGGACIQSSTNCAIVDKARISDPHSDRFTAHLKIAFQ